MKFKILKQTFILSLVFGFTSMSCKNVSNDENLEFINENVEFAASQTNQILLAIGEPNGENYPRTTSTDGKLKATTGKDWTEGFFPGTLWYLYGLTRDEKWKGEAEKWTSTLEYLKTFKGNHDIGFLMYCSFGNAERFAPKPAYKDILVESAKSLCTRYNDTIQALESWDYRKAWDSTEWFYPVIIDNMMNLELLFYASKISGDKRYYDVAVAHANTTLKNHFRDDFSSYHVVDYDQITGQAKDKATCQGYSDNSTWARGQAWAIYGYTMMYRETKDSSYLDAAKRLTEYYLKHLPKDMVPLWDFNVGQEGYTPQGESYAVKNPLKVKDASAAAIVCSALFELGELAKDKSYTESAIKMLKSLSSPAYRAKPGENANFILMHSTGSLPHNVEIDVPLVYADYYYLEALFRYKSLIEK